MSEISKDAVAISPVLLTGTARSRTYWQNVRRRLSRDRATMLAGSILGMIVLLAVFAPFVSNGDPYTTNVMMRLKPIGTEGYWLGTDELGRDIWTRLVYGGRISLLAGFIPVLGALSVGGTLGVIAGYRGGRIGNAIMRCMDVFYAFPSVLLAVGICAAIGPGLTNSMIALSVVFIPPIARISESVTSQIRGFDFIDAARASGSSAFQIVRHHVLVNIAGPIFVYATSLVSISIILAAGLNFLGLGVAPPIAEWGVMLNALRQAIYVQPYVAILPGIMILLTSICINFVADGLRGAMDVRLNT
jgi:peptide/nickel transport system permease protein